MVGDTLQALGPERRGNDSLPRLRVRRPPSAGMRLSSPRCIIPAPPGPAARLRCPPARESSCITRVNRVRLLEDSIRIVYTVRRGKNHGRNRSRPHPHPVAERSRLRACVPLKALRRIIDSGLLQGAVKKRKGRRTIQVTALAGLKLAWETAGILTLEGRRRLVRRALDAPESETVRENSVSIDLRAIKNDVERGLASLEEAGKMVIIDNGIRGGAPCFRDTRITRSYDRRNVRQWRFGRRSGQGIPDDFRGTCPRRTHLRPGLPTR